MTYVIRDVTLSRHLHTFPDAMMTGLLVLLFWKILYIHTLSDWIKYPKSSLHFYWTRFRLLFSLSSHYSFSKCCFTSISLQPWRQQAFKLFCAVLNMFFHKSHIDTWNRPAFFLKYLKQKQTPKSSHSYISNSFVSSFKLDSFFDLLMWFKSCSN